MANEKMDFSKVLAVLSQPRQVPPPLENVERRRLEIPYITKDGTVDTRIARLILPSRASAPCPLIFVPHYEMGEDAAELRAYLNEGWAVACPAEVPQSANGGLTDDDLVFNNAALFTVRRLQEIDGNRVALVGGSAGGYMTLMLNALQLGICGAVANSPITNVYFNFYQYFPYANSLNLAALAKLKTGTEQTPSDAKPDPLALMKALSSLPIPFLAAVGGSFQPIMANFPDPEDSSRWEAFSPVALAEWFSNPIMINHSTSDVLVPIDQITRKFTYEKPGDSLPESFSLRMPENYPGKLRYSMEERLPAEETDVVRLVIDDPNEDGTLPFDTAKRFQINIYDNGPAEGYGSHSSSVGTGRWDDVPYLRSLFALRAVETNILTPEKLRALLDRYAGKSVQLPAHEGVDDSVYGSLEVYRQEVREELNRWTADNGTAALNALVQGFSDEYKLILNSLLRRS